MSKSIELRQQRAAIISQMRDAVKQGEEARAAKSETLAKECDERFNRAEAEERDLSTRITQMESTEAAEKRAADEKFEKMEQRGEKPGNKESEYRDAFKSWFCGGIDSLGSEQRSLLNEMRGTSNQVVGTTTLGGFTVPEGFLPELVHAMKAYSGIAQAARFLNTQGGNPLLIPTEDDTSTEAGLITEASAITVQDITFGQKQMDAYKYATQAKVSWELMQDSAFNMEAEINNLFVPRFGRAMNSSCTTGTGSNQPNGVVTASTLGKLTASASAITFAEIVDLIHQVDPAYRSSPSTGFMLNDGILAVIKKISIGSSDARPLWQPSVREGEPDRIEGYRYFINQAMEPALAAAKKVMLFGDFNYYVIRLVQELRVLRLNERYADNGLVGFVGFMRWDGECTNTAAIKHLITP